MLDLPLVSCAVAGLMMVGCVCAAGTILDRLARRVDELILEMRELREELCDELRRIKAAAK